MKFDTKINQNYRKTLHVISIQSKEINYTQLYPQLKCSTICQPPTISVRCMYEPNQQPFCDQQSVSQQLPRSTLPDGSKFIHKIVWMEQSAYKSSKTMYIHMQTKKAVAAIIGVLLSYLFKASPRDRLIETKYIRFFRVINFRNGKSRAYAILEACLYGIGVNQGDPNMHISHHFIICNNIV